MTPDLAAKLPGRGAWVKASRDAILSAAAKGLFSRAFKCEARLAGGMTAEGFAAAVEKGLEERALAALGLARRTGAALAGFDQVRGALKSGGVGVLVTARDAGADGAEKLARLAGAAPVVRAFSAGDLARALGREAVVHAAVLAGPHAARFLKEAARLSGFRTVFDEVGEVESAAG